MPYSDRITGFSLEQRDQGRVDGLGGGDRLLGVGAEPLEVVVEVRDVDHGQVGLLGVDELAGGAHDPVRRGDARVRAPVGEQGELAQVVDEPVVPLRGRT